MDNRKVRKPTVKKVVESKTIVETNPCNECKYTYDRKKAFCKSCVHYRG